MANADGTPQTQRRLLKRDTFGEVRQEGSTVVRDTTTAAAWLRPIAQWLARREAQALIAAEGIPGIPRLLMWDGRCLRRSWVPGQPMQVGRPEDAAYYRDALALLRRLHRRGIVHNDLAKEPNWLLCDGGAPGLVDFQLARCHRTRSRWFRLRAREDLRHLLKHKRTYRRHALTARQHQLLARPGWTSRLWRLTGKRLYLLITRRLLGWADREGATDRGGRVD